MDELFKITSTRMCGEVYRHLERYLGNEKVVRIPDGVLSIKGGAFSDCPDTEQIIIPASVEEVGNCAFSGCGKLKSLHFLGTKKMRIITRAFERLPSPLSIVFSGASAEWLASTAPYEREEHEYDNGWGGGAPGVYTKVYTCYPMAHSAGKDFICKIKCLADKIEITATGEIASNGYRYSQTPYDD